MGFDSFRSKRQFKATTTNAFQWAETIVDTVYFSLILTVYKPIRSHNLNHKGRNVIN